MKLRAAGKLEQNEFPFEPSAGDAAVRARDLHCVWLPEPAASAGSREIYCVVLVVISAVRHRDRLGYVPVLALKTRVSLFPHKPSVFFLPFYLWGLATLSEHVNDCANHRGISVANVWTPPRKT